MNRKHLNFCATGFAAMLIGFQLDAQTIQESVEPLSKAAQKGFLSASKVSDGKLHVIFRMQNDKKKDDIVYEDYTFATNDLKFLGAEPVTKPKATEHPSSEIETLSAFVGGNTSFDILSMKLKITKQKVSRTWNERKEKYTRKVLSSETLKLRNDNGEVYYGIDKFFHEGLNKMMVFAYTETQDKSHPRNYELLSIDFDGNVEKRPLDLDGNYSVVYMNHRSKVSKAEDPGDDADSESGDGDDDNKTSDYYIIMAPNNGELNQYQLLQYDAQFNLKKKIAFKSPATNLLVNDLKIIDGNIYLLGTSINKPTAYYKEFEDYTPITSANKQIQAYDRAAAKDVDNFHFLKFTNGQLEFATTAPIESFRAKLKTPPSQKHATPYKGRKLLISCFEITLNNEFIVAGQIKSRLNIGTLKDPKIVTSYEDLVCLHFDAKGELRAQYAVEKMNDDKKSEIFEMPQKFVFSADGKYLYWTIWEVKGKRGYANFWDAYEGRASFYPHYFPRIAKIDLANASVGDFQVLGKGKYWVRKSSYAGRYVPSESTYYYIGRDDDDEELWVGKIDLR